MSTGELNSEMSGYVEAAPDHVRIGQPPGLQSSAQWNDAAHHRSPLPRRCLPQLHLAAQLAATVRRALALHNMDERHSSVRLIRAMRPSRITARLSGGTPADVYDGLGAGRKSPTSGSSRQGLTRPPPDCRGVYPNLPARSVNINPRYMATFTNPNPQPARIKNIPV